MQTPPPSPNHLGRPHPMGLSLAEMALSPCSSPCASPRPSSDMSATPSPRGSADVISPTGSPRGSSEDCRAGRGSGSGVSGGSSSSSSAYAGMLGRGLRRGTRAAGGVASRRRSSSVPMMPLPPADSKPLRSSMRSKALKESRVRFRSQVLVKTFRPHSEKEAAAAAAVAAAVHAVAPGKPGRPGMPRKGGSTNLLMFTSASLNP